MTVAPPDSAGPHRAGAIGLIGRPNAGKSTLLNALLGGKLAIVSDKPQTTRHRIAGILTRDTFQAVLVDTPGLHDAWTELNRQMVSRARSVLAEVDVVAWIVDTTSWLGRLDRGQDPLEPEDDAVRAEVVARGAPLVLVLNKIDRVPLPRLLPLLDALRTRIPFTEAVPVSAASGDGVPTLERALQALLPVGPRQYDPDEWAQVSERFLTAEVVREKMFQQLTAELPYATNVAVDEFDESGRESEGLVRIRANVIVERDSQKGIVIGKGGARLKAIGTAARKELEELLGCRVYLELKVKVEKDWTRTAQGLRRAGYE
jgi:GTP-binding protein Era